MSSTTILPPLKKQSVNLSSHTLNEGLDLVGKSLVYTLEWTGEFTKIQNKHYEQLKARDKELEQMIKPPNYKDKILLGLSKFTQKICHLCLQQRSSQNFITMCACQHPFCFSCLNTYAISKIQDMQRVCCPQPGCPQEMKLSSPVYKYLPEKIKLKYLEYLMTNKNTKANLKNKCLRCLEPQHTGQCKVIYNTETIERAFQFRKCKKCMTEIQFTEGRRKVCCKKCQHVFCYLCGQDWPEKGNHQCQETPQIKQLQKEIKNESCCQTDCCRTYDGCCVCCQCCESYCTKSCPSLDIRCCQNCGQCMSSCCYCDESDFTTVVGNPIFFFIRILLTVIFLGLYAIMIIALIMVLALWLILGISIGIFTFPSSVISNCEGFGKFLAILACPLLMLPGIFIGPMEIGDSFSDICNDCCNVFNKGICDMWIQCSPRQCCS